MSTKIYQTIELHAIDINMGDSIQVRVLARDGMSQDVVVSADIGYISQDTVRVSLLRPVLLRKENVVVQVGGSLVWQKHKTEPTPTSTLSKCQEVLELLRGIQKSENMHMDLNHARRLMEGVVAGMEGSK